MGDTSLFSRANSTAPPTPSWRPSPNTRGTRDIVSTCLATLLICVWKAVHTDIPLDQSQSNFTDKLGWLVIGIFAPDVLLYTACCQLERALRYRDYAGKYLDCPPEPPGWPSHLRIRASRLLEYIGSRLKPSRTGGLSLKEGRYDGGRDEEALADHIEITELSRAEPQSDGGDTAHHARKHPWTLVHGFYAAMGGFIFETSTPILGKRTRFALTLDGVLFLMQHSPDLLPDLSEESILNRSRSDSLGKALLIIQLLYFCISCAVRGAQSLSLSLLEIATLAHALCAVATYLVWWKKPFDVAEPTVISGTQADEAAAFLLLISDACKRRSLGFADDRCISEFQRLRIARTTQPNPGNSGKVAVTVDDALEELDLRPRQKVRVGDSTFSFTNTAYNGVRYSVYGKDYLPYFQRDLEPGNTAHLDKSDLARWRLAERAMVHFPVPDHVRYPPRRSLVSWHGGLRDSLFLDTDGKKWWPYVLSIIAVPYASCHLLGWDSTFPTSVERTMWRAGGTAMTILGISPVALTALSPIILILTCLNIIVLWIVSSMPAIIAFIVYPTTSCFLIVESIRQLFYLPDSAFTLPDFSIYLPHFA